MDVEGVTQHNTTQHNTTQHMLIWIQLSHLETGVAVLGWHCWTHWCWEEQHPVCPLPPQPRPRSARTSICTCVCVCVCVRVRVCVCVCLTLSLLMVHTLTLHSKLQFCMCVCVRVCAFVPLICFESRVCFICSPPAMLRRPPPFPLFTILFYFAGAGSIVIDGVDVTALPLKCVREVISVIPQVRLQCLFIVSVGRQNKWGGGSKQDVNR